MDEHQQLSQHEGETEQELFLYDGPIDPDTEQAIQELNDGGAKAFALQDYELAVEKFGLASEMLGQVYGEMNPKCADTLFMYGKALLEHAIQQSSVLGGVTEKKSKEELEAVVAAATSGSSSSSSAAPSNPRFVFEGDEEDDEGEGDDDEADPEAGASSGNAEGGDDQDDFAVAWDVLDLARVLFHRQGTEEALLKLGDVHIALGDVSLESENFDQAVADFREAIVVKEARLSPDDRQLAEAHYKVALALEYSPTESEKAQEHIHKAITVLRARIEKLNGMLASGKGKARATDANESETKMAKELIELHELVGEMEQKVQDLIANQAKNPLLENTNKTQIEMLNEMLNQKKAVAANDISNLIKPKSSKPASTPAAASVPAAEAASSLSSSSSSAVESAPATTESSSTSALVSAETTDGDSGLKRKAEEAVPEDGDKKIKV
ncbi:hypothetical protein BC939DRAFT_405994 [Gamsiella multidivaricata]|uniref:uncharacterized protein n=1 Tax=Gamsiella multidivaricata TaxID=101098 RepID=UPI00221E5003|nr:uncharacterized protein BC939DRAFT_405994 [Gamsiella multidivaricata]KAG0366001.1 hypothetical protein BGZ54_005952 [Gamsiella multidivaricata]KAI7831382.1 hypothetical protein BC939DRAFT_405994 [Gamsiella multidivaricata]